jgi:hypothetical protein
MLMIKILITKRPLRIIFSPEFINIRQISIESNKTNSSTNKRGL